MIGRREVLGSAIAGIGVIAAARDVSACTLVTPSKIVKPFRSSICERQIRQIVDFANIAHSKTDEEVLAWSESNGIYIEYDGDYFENYRLLKNMRISNGKLDLRPIKIIEINLIRQVRNKAIYQFTLNRNMFLPPCEDDCNTGLTCGEIYSDVNLSFLARFKNNYIRSFRDFPEWLFDG